MSHDPAETSRFLDAIIFLTSVFAAKTLVSFFFGVTALSVGAES
jgi:hypothetical protein